MTVQSYRQLVAWQRAMDLVKLIYEETGNFPKQEIYGLTNELRRAAVSIPSQIAGGQGRESTEEFLHHLSTANGSLMETETHVLIAESLGYLNTGRAKFILEKTAEIGRLINGLSRSLKQNSDY